ncbi:MFS transporter [Pseudalkalibacillus salsuginis]|uniref:MFS transporter n=1 Tax=Pseudalkalibacillus salsuginis TaxID=2910972 RepID=UPI001F1C64B8|nr:MFS transporter [Pseudalkalibacillus salsuginis]MCF6408345.1 MFS transporter [Pseudalkalibacillus salsuginis]
MEAVVETRTQGEESTAIWKNRNFLWLWIAELCSSFGLSIFMFSQSWYVVEVMNLQASLGLVFIASSIPRVVFMILGGAVADRFNKNVIMFLSDILRAIVALALVVWLLLGDVSIWSFVMFALVFGVLDAFFWPANSGLLPSLIDKQQLTRANSVIQMTSQSSFIIGPMLAGAIIALGSYVLAFSITAVLLVIASIAVFLIRIKKKEGTSEKQSPSNLLSSIKEGIDYVKQSAFLCSLLLFAIFINLFMVGPLQMGLPLFVKNVIGGNSLDFSYLEGSFAGGMLVGSILIGILNIQRKRGLVVIYAVLGSGLFFALFSFTDVLWQSLVLIALLGSTFSVINIPIIAAIQSVVKQEMIGRVMSLLSMASLGLVPVSFAITSGVLSFGVDITSVMLTGATLIIIFAIVVFMKVPGLRNFE